ncbi:S-layer homology domain-containing protein [Nostoc sp. 106C]|uniref:S-layer homology domain-containing protein n=1 Tax=Nostoc sp. 106C TaxID=1932667 RepID=UPI000A37ED40|nr:S-layer homology domain-containing protein [Nostoc sp. 106C]OUL24136.1 hypothetical protein BV375_24375 [Nostoc sp. 106C]
MVNQVTPIVNLQPSKLVKFLLLTTLLASSTILGAMSSDKPLRVYAQTPTPTPSPSVTDIKGDRYATEIGQAVTYKIMSGFEDNTFRPQASLTREQMVSMVVESLKQAPLKKDNLPFDEPPPPKLPTIPTQVTQNPFPDVDKTRWSAAKIQYVRDLGIFRGYADGKFRPTQAVTRAELVVVLDAAYRYIVELRGWDGRGQFEGDKAIDFSDTQKHWARDTIRNMSAACRAASPLNETGTAFAPNRAAQRNYAAAAIVRTAQCWSIPMRPPS